MTAASLNTPELLAIGGAVVGVGYLLYFFLEDARDRHKYAYLAEVMQDYGSDAMKAAVAGLKEFRDRAGPGFVEAYAEIHKKYLDVSGGSEIETAAPDPETVAVLYRRKVSNFFLRVGKLYQSGALPRRTLATVWPLDDLQLVPEVVVPLENRIRSLARPAQPLLSEDHALVYLAREIQPILFRAMKKQAKRGKHDGHATVESGGSLESSESRADQEPVEIGSRGAGNPA